MKSSETQKKESNSNSKTSEPSFERNKEDDFFSQFQNPTNPFTSQSKKATNPFASQSEETANPFSPQSKENANPFLSAQVTAPHTTNSIIQKQSSTGSSLSLEEAKEKIYKATKGLGTDEDAIYDAIKRCEARKNLLYDAGIISALRGDMEDHDLWKCFLLMEYGDESKFPQPVQDLWKATKGAGTDEEVVFKALESMDKQAKKSFGLRDFLGTELSGDDLQRAFDLLVVSDTIKGNIYGSKNKGEEGLVVNEANLSELIDSQFVGAASERLKNAMIILYNKPEGSVLSEALTEIESIRGLPSGSALAQYQKAMKKQQDGIEYYKKKEEEKGKKYNHTKDNPSPALDTSKHKSFTASNAQLRFGKIIGDAFGIDAVFGSLISPTGGMAGPANDRVPIIKDGGAVATHGAIHDAAGYLYNCHGIGPGYDYLQSEVGSDPENPFAGQSNMKWWINKFDDPDSKKDVQVFERMLNKNTYILEAFSKKYKELNTEEKKKALKVMSQTSSIMLSQGGISNKDRIDKINELMTSCNEAEKMELANYFYYQNGFNTVSGVYDIMKPHVSNDVYKQYMDRLIGKSTIRPKY